MANFDIPSPATLDALDKTQPLGTEDRSKLDDALRQTRALLKDVFENEHNADGTHKQLLDPALAPGSVVGSHIQNSSDNDAQRAIGTNHIKDSSVTEPKIQAAAVTKTKIANSSIDANRLEADAVTTSKILDGNVTEGKLALGAVTSTKLGAKAVGTAAIADLAVGTLQIGALAVSPDKLSNIGNGKVLVGDGAGVQAATIGGDMTGLLNAGTLELRLVNAAFSARAVVIEGPHTALSQYQTAPVGVNGEGGDARPVFGGSSFSLGQHVGDFLSISGTLLQVKVGTYLCRWRSILYSSVPAENNAADIFHRSYIYNKTLDSVAGYGGTVQLGQVSMGEQIIDVQGSNPADVNEFQIFEKVERLVPAATSIYAQPIFSAPLSTVHNNNYGLVIELIKITNQT